MAAFSYQGVDFLEYTPGSPDEAWGQDNSRITALWKVPWDERYDAKTALLGTISAAAGDTSISRISPHAYPKAPWLYAKAVTKVEGIANTGGQDDDGMPNFEWAKLTTVYEALEYDVLDDGVITATDGVGPDESFLERYIIKSVDDSSQFLAVRGGTWLWADGLSIGKPVTQDTPLLIPKEEITYVWVQVPKEVMPETAYRTQQGTTNSTTFDNYDPGKLLYLGRSWKPSRWHDGTRTVNITIKMKHFPNGVNFFPDPKDNNNFHKIINGANVPFPSSDFHNFFRPGT